MNRIAISSIILATMITELATATPTFSKTESLAKTKRSHSISAAGDSPVKKTLIAQLLYPPVSDHKGVMVQGQGEANAPADIARIEFLFSNSKNPFEPTPQGRSSSLTGSITQKTLQPLVDALVALGVPTSAIEVNINPTSPQSVFFPFPTGGSGSAQVLVKLEKPTRDRVQQIVTVASNQKNLGVSMQNVGVKYEVNDCQALEAAAYLAAVKNAQSRAKALSEALGVKIADTPSVAESDFSSLFGGLFGSSSAACSLSKVEVPLFPFNQLKQVYDPSAPAQVRVRKEIFATYTIR